MKSFLVIGMGRFGQHLARKLTDLGNEVMVVDRDEEALEELFPIVSSAKIGDCTKIEVLKSIGVSNFDYCIVCIGKNFQSSLEITSLLKDLGAKYVISKAGRNVHEAFLLLNGADEVVYPERDLGQRLAVKLTGNHVFDYLEMGDYGIYEVPTRKEWIGKSIKEVNFRVKYHVNILGTKEGTETDLMPGADHIFTATEHLLVIGKKEDVDFILKHLDV